MAQEYGFFDSTSYSEVGGMVQGNKAKNQDFFARYFHSFITNGVYTLSSFAPSIVSGMTLSISAGECFINGYFAYNDEAVTKTFSADTNQHEYWCVQRCDTANGEINLLWIDDPASGLLPSRSSAVYDLVLCKVTIPGGASSLTASMINDTRSDAQLCGVVSAINDALSGDITPQWAASVSTLLACAYAATSTTEAATALKMASVSDATFTLRTGVLVALTLSNGNTAASPSVNINGLGSVPIVCGAADGLDKIWPNGPALLVYDGANFVLINSAGSYLPLSGGVLTGRLKANNDTAYNSYQVRNIALSTVAGLPTGNGALLGVYE